MNTDYPLRVYYDKSCPMCREEIHSLKEADHDDRLLLIDCSATDFVDEYTVACSLSQEALMNAMHVRSADGRWYIAVDAFVRLYAAVGFANVSSLWAHPRLRPAWDRLYPWVVRNRHRLSYLRVHKLMRWFIRRAAKRSLVKSNACKI